MFAKLLKHEWKATAGTLGVFSLAALGVGVLATILLRVIANFSDDLPSIAWLPIGTMLGGAALAIVAYALGSQIVLIVRFYKNKFTDEGYLTFTLPVTSHQILCSSLLSFIGWSVITTVVVVFVVLMAIMLGPVEDGLFNQEVIRAVQDIIEFNSFDYGYTFISESDVVYSILMTLQSLTGSLLGVFQIMTAITLGASIAKKHKVLAAFGLYYGMNVAIGIVSSMFSMIAVFAEMGSENVYTGMNISCIVQMVLNLALCAVGYLVMNRMISKKLNLP